MSRKKSIKILTDEEEDKPILGYESISETIVNIIDGSNPKFSIGIYGEWGTGKTTLMRLVEKNLSQKNAILTVWFNAWRYEREENFAITALLKTIAYAMEDHPIYREVKPIILRSIKIITKGILSEIASKFISRETVDQLREDLENKTLPYLDLLNEIDKDTIYFDGLHKIEGEIEKILKKPDYKSSRIVVFIDDLDRCSPLKALEVFESIKVFLDIIGFIFVIGLSHNTVSKLIEIQYEKAGIKGEHYIRKIIQLPIMLPEWKNIDTKNIIDNLIVTNKLDSNYSDLIKENKEIISTIVEPSPREIKRFINNFIISFEIFSKNLSIQPKEFLIVQSIKFRWENFYRIYTSDSNFRKFINNLLNVEFMFIKKILDANEFSSYLSKVEEEGLSRLEGQEYLFPLYELRKDIVRLEIAEKIPSENAAKRLEEIEMVGGLEHPLSYAEKYPELKTVIEFEGKEFSYFRIFLNRVEYRKEMMEKDLQRSSNQPNISFASKLIPGKKLKEMEMNFERHRNTMEVGIADIDKSKDIISKYVSKYVSQFKTIGDNIRYNYKIPISEIDYELWRLLKKEEKTIIGIKNWEIYRYAVDFSKEMLNPEVKINIKESQDNNTKTTINISPPIENQEIEKEEL